MIRGTPAERAARKARVIALCAEGRTLREIAAELGVNPPIVRRIAKAEGLDLHLRGPRVYDMSDGRAARGQLAAVKRELGAAFVRELRADDEDGVELQRLYAAMRCVLLDADALLPAVRARYAAIRKSEIDEAAVRGMGGMP